MLKELQVGMLILENLGERPGGHAGRGILETAWGAGRKLEKSEKER